MFLNQLSEKEKMAFVNLCIHAAKANGEFAEAEKEMIEQYCKEMNINFLMLEEVMPMEKIESLYQESDNSTKRIVILELLGLLYADGVYDASENKFVNGFVNNIGATENDIKTQEALLKRYLDLTQEMLVAINL